ncbi:MAG: sensor histidine kinase [Actinobacteria bacterium]|nr:MAG: sensor histidine kinase [Actinomycetota bacterium]
MLSTLRGRLVAGFLVVMLMTIALLSLAYSQMTSRQFETYMRQGRQMVGEEIVRELAAAHARGEGESAIQVLVEKLATRYGNRIIVWDERGNHVATADQRPQEASGMPRMGMGMMAGARRAIVAGGRTVGFVSFSSPTSTPVFSGPAATFIAGLNRYLLLGGLAAALLAVVLGVALADRLTLPLKKLTQAVRSISSGKLDQRVDIRAGQEVEELADAFNAMTENLAKAEELRRNLMTDVAHELRTPITSLQVHLEGVLDGAIPQSRETIRTLHEETRRLAELVEELRELSLAEAGQLRLNVEDVDVYALAEREVRLLAPRFEKKRVKLALDGKAPVEMRADRNRLVQVLRNLIENALTHTPAGGRVSVSLEAAGDGVGVSVSDTGKGISPEDLPFVFERFYRGDSASGGGSGIGLTIAKRLVQAHGGTIEAAAGEGGGTVMRVRFPAPAPSQAGSS